MVTCSRQWPQRSCALIQTFYFCSRKSDRLSSNSSNCLLTEPLWRKSDVGYSAGVTERFKCQILKLISKYKPASTSLPKTSFHLSVFPNDHSYFYLFFLLIKLVVQKTKYVMRELGWGLLLIFFSFSLLLYMWTCSKSFLEIVAFKSGLWRRISWLLAPRELFFTHHFSLPSGMFTWVNM